MMTWSSFNDTMVYFIQYFIIPFYGFIILFNKHMSKQLLCQAYF